MHHHAWVQINGFLKESVWPVGSWAGLGRGGLSESSAFPIDWRTGRRAWILHRGPGGSGTGALGPFCTGAALLYPAVLSLDSGEAGYPSGTQISPHPVGCWKLVAHLPALYHK